MKGNKPTANDVARLAGVSQSAVSMILNNKQNVSFSPDTIGRVYAAARQLNYRTKKQQSVPMGSTNPFIAVVSPTMANPYYSTLVQSIENEAARESYGVLVCDTYHDPQTENRYLGLLSSSAFHGIIYTFMPFHLEKVKALSLSVPTVVVGDKNQSVDIDTVELNSTEAGELMAKHLLGLGHRKMAFVTTPLSGNSLPRLRRLEGVRNEIKSTQAELVVVESDKSLMSDKYNPDLEYNVGCELAKSLAKDKSITAYLGVNDMVAYGILDALEEENVRVPQDASVVGFDNIFPSRFRRVGLTTIDAFHMEKGRDAFQLLYRKMTLNEQKAKTGIFRIEYKPTLLKRESTGPCPS